MSNLFRPAKVRSFMILDRENHIDNQTGEVNLTSLAESAAIHFNQDHLGGPLDDPDHWIWEIAAEQSERESAIRNKKG